MTCLLLLKRKPRERSNKALLEQMRINEFEIDHRQNLSYLGKEEITARFNDPLHEVSAIAAYALYKMGSTKLATTHFNKLLKQDSYSKLQILIQCPKNPCIELHRVCSIFFCRN